MKFTLNSILDSVPFLVLNICQYKSRFFFMFCLSPLSHRVLFLPAQPWQPWVKNYEGISHVHANVICPVCTLALQAFASCLDPPNL